MKISIRNKILIIEHDDEQVLTDLISRISKRAGRLGCRVRLEEEKSNEVRIETGSTEGFVYYEEQDKS